MVIFVVLWSYLLTTKLSCLQKNNFGHTNEGAIESLKTSNDGATVKHTLWSEINCYFISKRGIPRGESRHFRSSLNSNVFCGSTL